MKEATFYEKLDDKKVQCHLCPNNCIILPRKRGSCRVRENQDGKLITLVYGKLVSTVSEPIEKKPLFHFLPSSTAYSIATAGCNFHCKFCLNWEISQASPEDVPYSEMTSEEVVGMAKKNSCESIAYTYIEPSIFYEFILDCAKLARKQGIKNIMVTNGYLNPEPVKILYKYIDAANVDLKGFTEEFYRKICGGKLKPVLESLKLMKKLGVHVETTTLIIPGFNDDIKLIKEICLWINKNLGDTTPVHFSRFYPAYKMLDVEPTPEQTLEKAYDIAKEAGLKYIYIGNITNDKYMHTICPKCKKIIVKRTPFFNVLENYVKNSKCVYCGKKIAGVFK